MRTIKFRGKEIETGEWIYGHFFQRLGHYPAIVYPRPRDGKVLYYELAVEDTTVGQFTGLIDKNGKEIYEGDVLEWKLNFKEIKGIDIERNNIFYICFEDSEWKCKDLHGGSLNLSFLAEMLKPEIIGNIHDNPELI